MKTRFDVRGLDEVNAFLKSLPRGTMKVALKAVGDRLLGDDSAGLRSMTPYKYASRSAAYGTVSNDGAPAGYFSMKQFRYVMALVHSGGYTPGHRNDTTRGWYGYTEGDRGYVLKSNQTAAYYTQNDTGQARQAALAGHDKVSKTVIDNLSDAMRDAWSAAQQWIDEHKG